MTERKYHFTKGNKLWQLGNAGRHCKYDNADDLWQQCVEYFEWVEENPLIEQRPFAYQGMITFAEVEKMQAMTKGGLCVFLGIHHTTWMEWEKEGHHLRDVVIRVNEIIMHQKITGAAADLLNSNIIAREVGLTDKRDLVSSDGSMSPTFDASALSDAALKEIRRAMLDAAEPS